jgi:hypothetical protein
MASSDIQAFVRAVSNEQASLTSAEMIGDASNVDQRQRIVTAKHNTLVALTVAHINCPLRH